MPASRSARRAKCPKPKYTFSDDEDEFMLSSEMRPAYNPLPTPPLSATPPARSSHTRKRPSTHVRRPRNAFIIFRSEFCENQKMGENGIETDHRHISRIAAHVWNNLNEDKKQVYKDRADVEKAAHRAAYPDYRYAPAGRPRGPVKRKVKRANKEDAVRCRQLAELLISGVEGEAFQQAAKGLDEGVVDVELTGRTSRPAPKRSRPSRRLPARVPAINCQVSVEVNIKEESPSPPRDLGLLGSDPSPSSSDALHDTPEAEDRSQDHISTPELSYPPGHWKSEEMQDFESALQLAPYHVPMDDFLPLPSFSDDTKPELARCSHLRPGAMGGLTLAQLCSLKHAPSSPETLHAPPPLPLKMQAAQAYHNPADSPTLPRSASPSGSTALPVTPPPRSPPPTVSFKYSYRRAGRSPSPATNTSTDSWKRSADTEASLSHQMCELSLCYPDDPEDEEIDFDEYLTGL